MSTKRDQGHEAEGPSQKVKLISTEPRNDMTIIYKEDQGDLPASVLCAVNNSLQGCFLSFEHAVYLAVKFTCDDANDIVNRGFEVTFFIVALQYFHPNLELTTLWDADFKSPLVQLNQETFEQGYTVGDCTDRIDFDLIQVQARIKGRGEAEFSYHLYVVRKFTMQWVGLDSSHNRNRSVSTPFIVPDIMDFLFGDEGIKTVEHLRNHYGKVDTSDIQINGVKANFSEFTYNETHGEHIELPRSNTARSMKSYNTYPIGALPTTP
jgi:hypothetical protein